MPNIIIDGTGIQYELLGNPNHPAVVLTPGGRFAMDTPGLRELAEKLVAGGKQVLLWDRPNSGQSDVCLDGVSESEMHAEKLAKLVRALGLGPITVAAGSAGSRVSLIMASRHPDLVSHLIVWWISGGPIGLMQLAWIYCAEPANMVAIGGMEAVANVPIIAEHIRRHPAAREQILNQDPQGFMAQMQRWALAYRPSDVSPVPGMDPEHFAALTMPVLILRNGRGDISHPRETTDRVHALIPHSHMIDPPWVEDEWDRCRRARAKGEAAGPFVSWPMLAPQILDFSQQ